MGRTSPPDKHGIGRCARSHTSGPLDPARPADVDHTSRHTARPISTHPQRASSGTACGRSAHVPTRRPPRAIRPHRPCRPPARRDQRSIGRARPITTGRRQSHDVGDRYAKTPAIPWVSRKRSLENQVHFVGATSYRGISCARSLFQILATPIRGRQSGFSSG